MNYDQPRQVDPKSDRPDAGKWRYTSMNDGKVHAIGYCSALQNCPECKGRAAFTDVTCARCDSKGTILLAAEDTCPGHDTPEGAREHYRSYVFEFNLRLDQRMKDQQLRCQALLESGADPYDRSSKRCGAFTDRYATLGESRLFVLCDEHHTREVVEVLVPDIGDSIHS